MPSDLLASVAGVLAAVSWGSGDYGGGIAAKRLPVFVALLGAQAVGLAGAIAAMLIAGEAPPDRVDAAWAATAAVFGSVGLAALYRALADGRMGIVAPITGVLTAAIPVTIGIATAGAPAPARLAGFGLAIVAILLVSAADDGSTGRRGLLLAVGAGVSFGLYTTCLGQVAHGIFAPLAIGRATSVAFVLAMLVATRTPVAASLAGRRRVGAVVVLVGVLDLAGNGSFLVAAQAGGLALAAVLGSLYPVATVVLAAVLLREPVGRLHAVGIGAAALATVLIVGGG